MSKVEVNQVTQQCGTTLTVGGGACKTAVVDATTVTLGRCGGTVSLASGATQSGFGRTGTVDWITTPKVTGDSPVTGVTGKGYFLDTTSGTITLNLPAGAAGSIVSVADYAATWQTNNVTVAPNGSEKIGGVAQDAVLNTVGQSVTFVYVDSTQGWINTMDSTSNVRGLTPFIHATVSGACNTLSTAPDCANTKIATFLGPGTFCVSAASPCAANNLVSYMVVAGGGGGGGHRAGAGGAGGFREVKSPSATGYTASPLDGYPTPGNRITVSANPYPITAGGGGAAGTGEPSIPIGQNGVNGSDSIFSTITSAGGGYGAHPGCIGGSGGSGGGGADTGSGPKAGGAGNTPPTTPAQGFAGGTGTTGPKYGTGGGGGASAIGVDGTTSVAGNGGAGVATEITGGSVSRAGGGGGGIYNCTSNAGTGGTGGGGNGSNGPGGVATAGGVNLGGGGGGGYHPGSQSEENGAAGGSGIVIIRYKFQ